MRRVHLLRLRLMMTPPPPPPPPTTTAAALSDLAHAIVTAGLAAAPAAGVAAPPSLPPLPAAAAALGVPPAAALPAAAASPPLTPPPLCSAAEWADLLDTALALEASVGGGRAAREAATRALPTLLARYGGTLSPRDRALLRLLTAIDGSGGDGGGGAAAGAAARMHGPLARTGFLCGRAASAAHAAGALISPHPLPPAAAAARACILAGDARPDGRRAALTVAAWPYGRTLAADDADDDGTTSRLPSYHPAAADPAWLVPFAGQCLRDGVASPGALAECGALPIALRAAASRDAALRWAAADAVARAAAVLDAGDDAHPASKQLRALLHAVRAGTERAGGRVPSLPATFAADAAFVVCAPHSSPYAATVRALLRAPTLAPGDVPLLKCLSGGGRDARGGRGRLLALLRAGARGRADAAPFQRRYLLELAAPLAAPAAALTDRDTAAAASDVLASAAAAFSSAAARAAGGGATVHAVAAAVAAAVARAAAPGAPLDAPSDAVRIATSLACVAAAAAAHPPAPCASHLRAAATTLATALATARPAADAAWPPVLALARDAHAADAVDSTASPCLTAAHVAAATAAGNAAGAARAVAAAPTLRAPPVCAGDGETARATAAELVAAVSTAAVSSPTGDAARVLAWVAASARALAPAARRAAVEAVAAVADAHRGLVAQNALNTVRALLAGSGAAPAVAGLGDWRRAFGGARGRGALPLALPPAVATALKERGGVPPSLALETVAAWAERGDETGKRKEREGGGVERPRTRTRTHLEAQR